MGNYVAIKQADFEVAMEQIGFHREDQPGFWEMSWIRPVESKNGVKFPYIVRIDSSIDIRTGLSRDCGDDAIRLHTIDTLTGRPVKGKEYSDRAFRTLNALPNTQEKARDLFRNIVFGKHCPKCAALMVVRTSKAPGGKSFFGCTHYGPGNPWHCSETLKIAIGAPNGA